MSDEFYMERCLELARLRQGNVSPNPMVGCVIVCEDRIIGEGWHKIYGEAHAEVNAVNSVAAEDRALLCKSTLYVNLEPCSHWGKTPPCCDLIINQSIPRVIVGMIDPFSKVCGEGVKRLKEAGVDVKTGILENKCLELNKYFVTYNTKKRPYIILKWAQTSDGYLDNNRLPETPPTWMTGSDCKLLVHKRRAEVGAIMVGTNTIERDNPTLTVRMCEGRNPLRVVIDNHLRLSPRANVFNSDAPTIIFTQEKNVEQGRKLFAGIKVESADSLEDIIQSLYDMGIDSLYVEGGASLLNSFISKGLWDEMNVFISPLKVSELKGGNNNEHKGILAPDIKGIVTEKSNIENVTFITTRNL